ncbi:MAG TPA: right-handed parallel beta-helix repeat-containing protein [Gemmatimonadaceae bacterium]|nr:right-handed parallel beta-helix repeat-containing protein [Gemmatimonadaceae bacterium]
MHSPRLCRTLAAASVVAAALAPHAAVRAQSSPLPVVALRRGLVITHSVRVARNAYRLAAPASMDSAVITVRGDDVTVDFDGATLAGIAPNADPDLATGVGVRIDGGHNVRIINATIRGYKVGLLARGTHGLTLAHDDLGHNYKPRLFSLVEHESLADWLSHHHNEHDEWLRFGAGAYLADVRGGEIRDVTIEEGMEGLMLARSDSLRIWNNAIEFNSGVGIGLYRSSDNTIMHNRASYNVRGYSHGFYRRGQDSADLLIYEQSSGNVVAYNSMTHGGDGLFLWAGQSTMDTGEGGANDNVFFMNDFSFAPTNGMEATFARNAFVQNRVEGSDYGLWGGYSFNSLVVRNEFARNRTGIAIEHGNGNTIADNWFDHDSVAINLWANPSEPADWGYPKHHDTKSHDYEIAGNAFVGNRVAVRLANSSDIRIEHNRFFGVDSMLAVRDTSRYALADDSSFADTAHAAGTPIPLPLAVPERYTPAPLPGGIDARATDSLARRPRSAIIVDEWGPYDYRYPRLWPADSTHADPLRLRVLGPPGTWRVVRRRGVRSLSATSGRTGDTISVIPASPYDWMVTLEYTGAATESPRGLRRRAGAPYQFSYGRFETAHEWHVGFYTWSDSTDPRTHAAAFDALLRGTPAATATPARLDYEWYRPTVQGLPLEKWAAVATTTVALAPGRYTLRTISDDAIRVWIDGKLAIDDWTPHESIVDHAPIAGGTHQIRVEYYQLDGWTELRAEIVRGTQRSTGSAGPH